jgi:hypothetical protein
MLQPYPDILLPLQNYKFIKCDISDHFLIRHFDLKQNIPVTDENNDISQEYICSPKDKIQDLSTSLLGYFVYEHTQIELTEYGKKTYANYCLPNANMTLLSYPGDYIINDKRKYWVIQAGAFYSLKTSIKIIDEDVEALSYVQHTPMMWNFWHFSIKWEIQKKGLLDNKQIFSDKEQKKYADKIGSKVRSKIASLAKLELDSDIKILDEYCFKN